MFSNRTSLKLLMDTATMKNVLKGLCYGSQFILFDIPNFSPSITMELKGSEEITCK